MGILYRWGYMVFVTIQPNKIEKNRVHSKIMLVPDIMWALWLEWIELIAL